MNARCLTPGVTRLEGWESRLALALEAARHEPYVLGQHDCFQVACSVVLALTGVDLWPHWQGRYRTRKGALRHVAQFARGDGQAAGDRTPQALFGRAATRLFGAPPVLMPQALRGDIAEFRDDKGEPHLGVVVGAQVAVLTDAGLGFVARSACAWAWRVG